MPAAIRRFGRRWSASCAGGRCRPRGKSGLAKMPMFLFCGSLKLPWITRRRGGLLIRYTFPRDGQYDIQIRLTRDRNEEVEGLHEPHELQMILDRERIQSFTVRPPPTKDNAHVDDHLKLRLTTAAGPHDLGV